LALAESKGCELWTADTRMWNSLRGKLAWVRLFGDYPFKNREIERYLRSLELLQLHEEVWNELSEAGTGIQEYYSPAQWMPHITIGFGDITSENLPAIMRWLNERDFTWEFTVDNLAIGTDQELHSRYDIGN